jgi:hypothetical protein
LVFLCLIATLGCALSRDRTSTEVAYVGDRYPAKPDGCQVAFFIGEAPPYPTTTIATGQTACYERQACIDDLRLKACRAGADVVAGIVEWKTSFGRMEMSAGFSVAAGPPASAQVPPPPPAAPAR